MPKVSVIIPVYNTEPYLRECLDSVINQTLRDIEIICVDDGSADRSLEVLWEYAAKDNRIIILTQQNLNAGAARNKGLSIAKGKYLIFLDSDDYFESEMLESCFKKLEEDESDIVVFESQRHDVRTRKTVPRTISQLQLESPFCAKDMPETIFQVFTGFVWDKMFRRSFVEGYSLKFQEIPRSNDEYFVRMALVLAQKISFLPDMFTIYRVGMQTNLQSTNEFTPCSVLDASQAVKDGLLKFGLYEQYEQSFLNIALFNIHYTLYRLVDHPDAYMELFNSIKRDGERVFGFARHPKDYYNRLLNYLKYIRIINITEADLEKADFTCSELLNLYGKKLIVYGTGEVGELLIPYMAKDKNTRILGACVSDAASDSIWKYHEIEIPVRGIREWKAIAPDAAILITTTAKFHAEIAEICKKAGFQEIIPVWDELLAAGYDDKFKTIYRHSQNALSKV